MKMLTASFTFHLKETAVIYLAVQSRGKKCCWERTDTVVIKFQPVRVMYRNNFLSCGTRQARYFIIFRETNVLLKIQVFWEVTPCWLVWRVTDVVEQRSTFIYRVHKSKQHSPCRHQTSAVFWMLYSLFWVIRRCLKFICQRFGTLCQFFSTVKPTWCSFYSFC
jgi:hypothetical protein